MSNCAGICIATGIIVSRVFYLNCSPYFTLGLVRCGICECFIKPEDCIKKTVGFWCPCCRGRMKVRPRNKKYVNS